MRAREPDISGCVARRGVQVGFEVFGAGHPAGTPAVLLLTSWAIVHARQWKGQVPYLARHYRVVTVEGRGNGRADRPRDPVAYADREQVDDAVAVLDAVGVDRAVVVGLSLGGRHALQMAAWHPERVAGVVAMGPSLPWRLPPDFHDPKPHYDGAGKINAHYWRADFAGFVAFFMEQAFTEPRSVKAREDGVAWGLETDAETLLATVAGVEEPGSAEAERICRAVECPVLVVYGEADAIVPYATGVAIARWTGGELVTVASGGHGTPMRDPVFVNRLLRRFVDDVAGPRTRPASCWTRTAARPRRALYVPSAIGLGHVRRDLAIADELRRRRPDLHIDWLAQEPVAAVLAARGERVHPASRLRVSETAHLESEGGEHTLNAFEAVRRMDEIHVANFMVFADLVEDERHDLWIADEGWEIDHFLHDHPELKRAPYAWLSDFVGWLPLPEGGDREAALTDDWNAERVERMWRLPRLRDRSLFVGNPADLVEVPLGAGLPTVREWALERYRCTGWVTAAASPSTIGRADLRDMLGYAPDERVCVVAIGGTALGAHLLRRVAASFPGMSERVPGLRMVLVAGPRIDPRRAGRTERGGGARLRPRPRPAPGRLRPRRGAGRAHHDDGAGRRGHPVPLRPARPALRTAGARAPSAGAVPGRTQARLRRSRRPGPVRRGRRRDDGATREIPAGRDGRSRAGRRPAPRVAGLIGSGRVRPGRAGRRSGRAAPPRRAGSIVRRRARRGTRRW